MCSLLDYTVYYYYCCTVLQFSSFFSLFQFATALSFPPSSRVRGERTYTRPKKMSWFSSASSLTSCWPAVCRWKGFAVAMHSERCFFGRPTVFRQRRQGIPKQFLRAVCRHSTARSRGNQKLAKNTSSRFPGRVPRLSVQSVLF